MPVANAVPITTVQSCVTRYSHKRVSGISGAIQALGSLSWTYFSEQAGVRDIGAFDTCVNAATSMETIEQRKVIADALGVRGTPAIFVNGWQLPMVPSLEVFDRIVVNAIEGRQPTENISFAPPVAQN